MRDQLIKSIKESNSLLHEAKERMNNLGFKIVALPDEWFFDDLDENASSEMELIEYLFSKWIVYHEEQHKWTKIDKHESIQSFIFEDLLPKDFNSPNWIIEILYEVDFVNNAFENIYKGKYTLEEYFEDLLSKKLKS
ncbi:hypothetical protein ACFVAD_19095 [Sutcliffiella sp. NPDC057660]|uniref:hypothetical protein n=1 Tax=Sutcliffiella sp. NPDC057660 TaxID=3346199 RepID=UPI00369FB506